jgi:glycosyltransferase involved in cell wall biosynthesis
MAAAVSIIIPNKNRCEELVQTLASVRAQTRGDFECVIVDDRSTDDFDRCVAPFLADGRFSVRRQPEHRNGAPAARNDGAAVTTAPYVVFLDSDDLLAPECLAERVRFMENHPSLDFAVFPCELFRQSPGDVGLMWNADTGENDLDRFLRHDVPWQTTAPIWRRAALAKVGPWDEAARSAQDWEFHVRALLAGLRYARAGGPADLFWRMAAADRDSIGKSSVMSPDYHRARLGLFRRVYATLREAGQLNEFRRRCFAGMYFTSVEKLGWKVSRSEGRRAWRELRPDGVFPTADWLRGWWLFANLNWPTRYGKIRRKLEQTWPAEYFLPRSRSFMKTPAPRVPGAAPQPMAEVA